MTYQKSRILLLPGFSEDQRIFRHLNGYFDGYDLHNVDYRDVLASFSPKEITLSKFIQALINQLQIKESDIIIGHSLGGFISHQIKQKVDVNNCMIASFTDPRKIKLPLQFKRTVKWLTKRGLFGSTVYKKYVHFRYNGKSSLNELKNSLEVLESYDDKDVFKLVKLLLPKTRTLGEWLRSSSREVAPDLILHPERDTLVQAPTFPYVQVPGDHFTLATHPDVVGKHLEEWLLSLRRKAALESEVELEIRHISDNYLQWVA